MSIREIKGRINSIETLGTLDGPGVRFVVFMQGCPLRCSCCHNPETWDILGGEEKTVGEIFDQIGRFKSYFGTDGGVTVSGGEALLQSEFVGALFELCKKDNINTCLDTSGCMMNDKVCELLDYTDLVMLDIKYTTDEKYWSYTGCEAEKILDFLAYLNEKNIDTWLRQVLISDKNDDKENLVRLSNIAKAHPCVKKCELLAFRKLCTTKYDKMGLEFPFEELPETTPEMLNDYQNELDKLMK